MKPGDVIFIKNGRYIGETTKILSATEYYVQVRINNIDVFINKKDASVRSTLLESVSTE